MLGLGVASVLNGTERVPLGRHAERHQRVAARRPDQRRADAGLHVREPGDGHRAADQRAAAHATSSSTDVIADAGLEDRWSSRGVLTRDQIRLVDRRHRRRRQHRPGRRRPRRTPSCRSASPTPRSTATATGSSRPTSRRARRPRRASSSASPRSRRPPTPPTTPCATRSSSSPRSRSRTARSSTSRSSRGCRRRPTGRASSSSRPRTRSTPPSCRPTRPSADRRPAAAGARRARAGRRRPQAGCKNAALTMIVFGVLGAILSLVIGGRVGDARSHDPGAQRHHRQVRRRRAGRRPRDRRADARPMAKRKLFSLRSQADGRSHPTSSAASPTAGWRSSTTDGKPRPHHPVAGRLVAALLPRPGRAAQHRGPAVAARPDVGPRRRGRDVRHPVAGRR